MELCCQTQYEAARHVDFCWWMANVANGKSRVPLVCRKCRAHSGGTALGDFERNQTAACWCNGGIKYASESGRMRVLSWCTGRLQPTGFMCEPAGWKQVHVKAQTKLPVRCSECMVTAQVTVNSLDKQRTIMCPCSKRCTWSINERRLQLLAVMSANDLAPSGNSLAICDQQSWEALNPSASTRVTVTCLQCKVVSTMTSITTLAHRGTIGCGCRNKTEAMMVKLVAAAAARSGMSVKRQAEVGKSVAGGSLRCDAGLYRGTHLVAVFECDGCQHFRNSFCTSDEVFQRQLQRDLLKEQLAVKKGVAVVRMYQPDLWGGNGRPKRDKCIAFIRLMVHKAAASLLEPRVHCQPDVSAYQSGVYKNMRGA